ncbi:hypothetical protein SAMN05444714_2006 [Yoonia litorea]|uniref:Uncharacterized protein n=1 Tax=Yoonia litorea TaxID=1123755 RepID=A0A1I6MLN0_9RHOB|nr:hypothetical protein SAMN05444714_2006 [Yoonia litorea]
MVGHPQAGSVEIDIDLAIIHIVEAVDQVFCTDREVIGHHQIRTDAKERRAVFQRNLGCALFDGQFGVGEPCCPIDKCRAGRRSRY